MSGDGQQSWSLAVEDLEKSYVDRRERVRAVDGVTFHVDEGAFYTLLGPSGCGKTTTLRCVAGLERHDGGRIVVDRSVVSSQHPSVFVPPHKRNIGMVFQSYAIWPHMTVFENAAFPLRVTRTGLNKQQVQQRVEEALNVVQLGALAGRMATQLSGGQQQRLALARALVREPRVLLLDEPLSNLDAKLREQMRAEVRALQRRLGITTLYVTHDQVEALSMSNRIAVLSAGQIVQEGTPLEIYQHPTSRFVADFVGSTNFLEAEAVQPEADGRFTLRSGVGVLTAAVPEGTRPGDRLTLCVRPENIRVFTHDPARPNILPGTIEQVMFLGEQLDCRVRVGQQSVLVRQHPTANLQTGGAVFVEFPPELCSALHEQHGATIAATDEPAFQPA